MNLITFILTALLWLDLPRGCLSQPDACEDVLQARLDCYDTDGPCDPLPIPTSAFGMQPDPSKGYTIVGLREGIYAIGEGSYWMMAAVAPLTKQSDRRRYLKKKMTMLKKKKKKHMMTKHSKMSKSANSESSSDTDKYTGYQVVVFDFPEGSFVQRDSTGAVVGSLITTALDEIVFGTHGLTAKDIAKVSMVYSHQHFDHIGGAAIVYDHIVSHWQPRKIDVIGQAVVKEEFEARIKSDFFSFRAPIPNVLVEDEVATFSIGAVYEYTLTPLSGHTTEKDLVVFIEKDVKTGDPAIMMYVDVIFPGWAPFFSFAITTDIFNYLQAHVFLLEKFDLGDDGIFVGGHLAKLGSRFDIETSLAFAQSVMAGAQLGLQQVDFNAIVAASGVADPNSNKLGNSWLLFDEYFKAVVKICAKQVVAEWGCKLGAVDVVVDSHCRSAQSFWRVDY